MRAQVSFEAMVNIGFLMIVMGAVAWSVNSRLKSLSVNDNKNFLEDACAIINRAVLTSLNAPNTTITAQFSKSFNLSFNQSPGFALSINDFEYLCLTITDGFVNSSLSNEFSLSIVHNASFLNDDGLLVVS